MNELESRAKEMEDKNSNLEERISTLMNENTMLRKVTQRKMSNYFVNYNIELYNNENLIRCYLLYRFL